MNTPKEHAEALETAIERMEWAIEGHVERNFKPEAHDKMLKEYHGYLNVIRTALSAQAGWRLIDDEAKKGMVDIWDTVNERRYVDCVYNEDDDNWYDPQGFIRFPSHYSPLPSPPAEGKL